MLNYVPARLQEGRRWMIIFYVRHPVTKEMVRQRIAWGKIKSIRERRRLGKQMCEEINSRLRRGWNPLIVQTQTRDFEPMADAMEAYMRMKEKQLEDGLFRPASMNSYRSYMKVFKDWLDVWYPRAYTIDITRKVILSFLDYMYVEKGVSATSRNNYRDFLHRMCEWFLEHEVMVVNPVKGVKALPVKSKKRKVIPAKKLVEILKNEEIDWRFRFVMKLALYCLIRPSEMVRLRVEDVSLAMKGIKVNEDASKTKRDGMVGIPDHMMDEMLQYIQGAESKMYLLSRGFKPGWKPMHRNTITKKWDELRKQYKWPDEWHFYSLKDTGITEMMRSGIPVIQVRDQARHTDLSMTNRYAETDDAKKRSKVRKFQLD